MDVKLCIDLLRMRYIDCINFRFTVCVEPDLTASVGVKFNFLSIFIT